jgi:glycosyltransferase involved in cell wall biosynthesis
MTIEEQAVESPSPPAPGARVLSVVVPVYRNEATLPELVDRLRAMRFPNGIECRPVFVIDGSPDRSEEELRARLEREDMRSTLVVLSRNFGSFAAIRAGLEAADGDYCAVMAADLQEPPELLVTFVEQLETGQYDLVLGRREGRADPVGQRVSAGAFWWMYRRFVQPAMPEGGVDVFACNRTVRAAVLALREANSSLIGLLVWFGFRSTTVGYERQPRLDGAKSSWTLSKKFRYMSDSIFSFTDLPIRVLLTIGVIGCASVAVAIVVVLAAWLFDLIKVAGYTPLMLAVLFTGFLVTLGMGIVGSYVWRAYENTKQRPLTFSQSTEHFGGDRHG